VGKTAWVVGAQECINYTESFPSKFMFRSDGPQKIFPEVMSMILSITELKLILVSISQATEQPFVN
jgi:hypothetical protein